MKPIKYSLPVALLLGISLLLGNQAQAYSRSHHSSRSYHSNYRGYRPGYRGYSPVNKAYADLARANAIRAAAIRAAQAEVNRTYSALRTTRTRIERDFKFSSEMNAAEAGLTQARRELDAARKVARERLAPDPKFQAAKTAKDTAAINRMQSAADQADAGVRAALDRVQEAGTKITALKREFEGSVTSNPQWIAAHKNVENARTKLAQAHAAGNRSLSSANQTRTGYSRGYPRR